MSEVLKRIRYEFGRFRFDPHQHVLSDEQQRPVALTPRAFDMLLYLVERADQLIEKAALMKAVWPNVIVEENNLSQHLSALRRALDDGSEGERYIMTVPRRGYRFVAEVKIISAATDGAERSDRQRSRTHGRGTPHGMHSTRWSRAWIYLRSDRCLPCSLLLGTPWWAPSRPPMTSSIAFSRTPKSPAQWGCS